MTDGLHAPVPKMRGRAHGMLQKFGGTSPDQLREDLRAGFTLWESYKAIKKIRKCA